MSKRRAAIIGLAGSGASVGLCMAVLPVPTHLAPWAMPILVFGVALSSLRATLVVWYAMRHSRLAAVLLRRAHRTAVDGVAVHQLDGLEGALVAGLREPRIYCDPDLARRLAPDELRAVLLHETFHQLDRAPARLVILQAIAPFVHWTGSGQAWLARRTAALEIAADRYALALGVSRPALARALLKLAPDRGQFGVGFASAGELRLEALLDDSSSAMSGRRTDWLLLVAAVAGLCVLIALAA